MLRRNWWLVILMVFGITGALLADVCEQAEREIARTDELITEAEPTIMGSGNEEAIALYEQGVEVQEQARSLYSEGNCLAAMRKTHEARALVRRALALVRAGGAIPDSSGFPFPGTTPSPSMVERYLNETDDIIARNEPTIRESGNAMAIELLNRAIELQTNAWDEFHAGHYNRAFMLSRQARTLVERALRLVETPLPPIPGVDSSRVARELERTDGIIEEYRDTITSSGDERAIELFTHATETEGDAHSAYGEGRYGEALRLTLEARALVMRAIRMISGPGRVDSSFVAEALARTDRLLERASAIPCSSSEARELLNEATETQASARTAFEAGNYREALRLTNLARSLALRAIRLCGGGAGPVATSDSAMVANELARTDALIAELGPAINASGNPEAISTFNEGVSHQDEAYAHFSAGEYRDALAETRIARQLVIQAAMMAGVPIPGGPGCPGGGGPGGGGR